MAQSAAANRRQLGAEIQRLRKDRKLRAADVAMHLNCSETRISRIETGTGRAKLRDTEILALCELFGIDDERQIQSLRDLASDAATASAWWDGYREVLPSGLEPLLGFETDARSEWAWEPLLIHGLLQTPAYARAILSAWPSNRPVDVDDLVAVRMQRAELLTTEERTPLELWAVLDESLLKRPIGSAEVMREQIHHLIDMSERTNVTLQILPHTKGAHPGLGGPFSILNFEDEDAAPVVYVDSPAGNLYLDKRHDVRKFTTSFDLLRAQALDPDTSTALLRDVAMEKERP